jgi:hypothetical protein
VWRWRTCADPNRPQGYERPHPWAEISGARIEHPLAARAGARCRRLCQGRNGNVLVEFEDGRLVVAPRYAIARAA